ncbi:hypothetical protein ASG43_18925 [Aureimonas sp. Leaf454]|nr:hypothetical protein ASG43_18925 [Aureimonas sp. Leaf454]
MLKSILISLALTAAFSGGAAAETLNLLTWEKYISPRVVETWTRETGIELNQIFFDSGEDRDRIIAGGNSEIDIAVMNESVTKVFLRKGLLDAVTEATVPTIGNSVPRWRERCSGYGLPYFWGTLGIVYRADKVTAPTSWSDLLRPAPELASHIAMMTGFDDLLTPSLILNGKSINTQAKDELQVAFATLKEQSPSVRTYNYIMSSSQDAKIGSELFMALAYSGDQFALAKSDGHDWRYVLPKEGSVLWVDCMGVLTASKRRTAALKFLDFLNRPEISAMNAADLSLPTANAAAVPLLPAGMRDNPEVFPTQSVIDASSFYEENGAQTVQVRKRIANSLINYHDSR